MLYPTRNLPVPECDRDGTGKQSVNETGITV
jgi:hypothetical protein